MEDNMILYFTGTGNSKFVADYLAEKLNDETLSLNNIIKAGGSLVCESEKPYVTETSLHRLNNTIRPIILEKSTLMGLIVH